MNIIEKNNLVDEAYNQLLQMIASGEWVEGSKLPSESQLCETLGVSRNTVRVALSKLNALGLIESRQGFGYSVRNLNIGIYLNSMLPTMLLHSRDLESITEFRIGVESEAAAVAEDLERMRVACEKAEAHMGDPDMFAKYDMEFHRAVAEASKNQLFIKAAEMLESMYTVWLMGLLRTHGMEKSHVFHYNIYRSIANKKGDDAKRYMTEHMEDVLRKVRIDNERKRKLKEKTEQ